MSLKLRRLPRWAPKKGLKNSVFFFQMAKRTGKKGCFIGLVGCLEIHFLYSCVCWVCTKKIESQAREQRQRRKPWNRIMMERRVRGSGIWWLHEGDDVLQAICIVGSNYLGGGFKCFLFSSLFGDMIQFDEYFSDGWFNHQLVTRL